MIDRDERLAALLSAPALAPDPAFVARIAKLVEADAARSRAQSKAWRRFAVEAAAAGAIGLAALVIARIPAGAIDVAAGPGLAGALALLCWLLTRSDQRLAL
jgi:hypothetical protein